MDILQKRLRQDPIRLLYEEPELMEAEIYHELSKINEINGRRFRRRMQSVIGREFFLKIISQSFKTYPTAEAFKLPAPESGDGLSSSSSLREMTRKRRSVRHFTGKPISLEKLSAVLQNSYGLTGEVTLSFNVPQKVRAVPSGGALYPLELYLGCFRVEGLESGLYHYNVLDHSLERVRSGLLHGELGHAFFYEDLFKQVAVNIIITGLLKRSSLKYGERAYRFMMLEAGHVGQNICLSSVEIGMGCVMLGGFYDDQVNNVIGIDGVNEMTLYGSAIGSID